MKSELFQRTRALTREGLGDLLMAQVVSVASSVVVTFVTAYFMGPELRGVVAYVLYLGNLLGVVAFGSYHVGAIHAERRGEGFGRLAGLRAAMASTTVLAIGGCMLSVGAWAAGHDSALYTLLATVGGALVCVNFFVLRLGQALGHDAEFRNASLISGLGFAATGSVLAALTREPTPIILAWITCLLGSTVYMLRVIDWSAPHGNQRTSLRRVIQESWSAHIATLGIQVLYRFNVVALGLFGTHIEVGLYSVAAPIAECTWFLSEAVSLMAFRHAVRESSPRRRLEGGHFVVTLMGGAAVALVAWVVLPLALPEFAEARLFVLVLLPGVLVQGAARVALAGILGRDPGLRAIVIGLSSIVAAAAYVPAAMAGGALGVAVTSSILYSLMGAAVIASNRSDRTRTR